MKKLLSCLVLLISVSCASLSCNQPEASKLEYDIKFSNESLIDIDWVNLVDGEARLSCGILEGNGAYSKVIMDCHRPLSGKEMRIEFYDDKIPVNKRKIPQTISIPPILDYNNKRIVIHILSPNRAKVELLKRP